MSENLAAALVSAQAEMPAVAKDGTNPHFHSKFVTLDALIAATRPVLNKHGLAIAQFPAHDELAGPTLVTRLFHVSGESIEYAQPLFLQGMDMQKFGAAITYARRYGWASALGIASDDDDDGTHASASPKKEIAQELAQPTDAVITEPQRKRLFAKAKERGLSDEAVKDLIKRIAGVDSSAAISKYKYDAVIASIEEDIPF